MKGRTTTYKKFVDWCAEHGYTIVDDKIEISLYIDNYVYATAKSHPINRVAVINLYIKCREIKMRYLPIWQSRPYQK